MPLPSESNSTSPPPPASYRALCPMAVASVAVGAVSIPILVFWFSWFWAVVPLAGIGLGCRALRQIRDAPQEWTGWELARLGIWLSLGMWVVGYGWLTFARVADVPIGYDLIEWDTLQADLNTSMDPVPQTARDLQEKRVFIKGYMQPRRHQIGIREFVLCPSNGDCAFCMPNPKPTQKIRVLLQGDLNTVYTTHLIGVGGRFYVDPDDPSGLPYSLKADCLR